MSEIDIIIKILLGGLAGWFGLLEWRLRKMSDRLDNTYSKEEVNDRIEIKQEAIKQSIENIKETQEGIKDDTHAIRNEIIKIAAKK